MNNNEKISCCLALIALFVIGYVVGSWNSNHRDIIDAIGKKIDNSSLSLSTQIGDTKTELTSIKGNMDTINEKVDRIDNKTSSVYNIFQSNQKISFSYSIIWIGVASAISISIPLIFNFVLDFFKVSNTINVENKSILVGFFAGVIFSVIISVYFFPLH